MTISEFKLELRSGNPQIGAKFVLTCVTSTFGLWPLLFAWTSFVLMVIFPDNFMIVRWEKHSENVWQTGRQTDWQRCSWSCSIAVNDINTIDNQSLHMGHVLFVISMELITSHYIYICLCILYVYMIFEFKFTIDSKKNPSWWTAPTFQDTIITHALLLNCKSCTMVKTMNGCWKKNNIL